MYVMFCTVSVSVIVTSVTVSDSVNSVINNSYYYCLYYNEEIYYYFSIYQYTYRTSQS